MFLAGFSTRAGIPTWSFACQNTRRRSRRSAEFEQHLASDLEGAMADLVNSFISKAFLRSVWALEFEAFKGSEEEAALEARLKRWSLRKINLSETSAEAAFIQEFFRDTWG
ncbi:MAG: hypothetical protein ACRECZ_04650, partial [Methylocella sp.]